MARVNGRSPVNGIVFQKTSIRQGYVFMGEERIGYVMRGSRGEWSWGTLVLGEDDLHGQTFSKREAAEACAKAWMAFTQQ